MGVQTPMQADLQRIRTSFLQMCVRAESMVRLSVRSVMERDAYLGRSVVTADKELDRLEVALDQMCLESLSERHPRGKTLRTIATVMKMVTDLERIGDLAVNVSQRGLALSAGRGYEPGFELTMMGEIAADMVRMAADSFLAADPVLAREILNRDRQIDELNRELFARAIREMTAHPDQVDRVLGMTSISKHLERVGDHACNLGEMVIFMVDGKDVRHKSNP